ncbi:MAG TPA: sulfatase-like hydrolase/transferase [Phycisphaerae bacterium]|nr:sulfatase-like hydrolase/transferase [Phycisphaerae bacterium]
MKKPSDSAHKTRPHRPNRRSRNGAIVLIITALLAGGVWTLHRLGVFSRFSTPKLNLLLITLDTTRADALGCYGGTNATTPNLDKLAAAGVRCTQCVTSCPMTLPAHASIMTGLSSFVHGARTNGTACVPASNLTLAKTLQAAGCRTRAVIASFVLNKQFGLDQGFEVYHDVVPPSAGAALEAERRADAVADDAIKLMQSLGSDRFFMWVHFYDPHRPYISARHPDRSSPEAYADEVSFMDEHIGRLLQELQRLKLDSNTLVVAVGDHGEGLGQHDEPTHGYFLYDTTLRVPLIFRCPGVLDVGRVVNPQIRTIDIAPTILALLGCDEMPGIQGANVLPLLRGQPMPSALPAYAESLEANAVFGLSPLRSLQRDGWKFILAPEPELYNLAADPNEANNLAAVEADRSARLRQELRTFIAEAPPPAQQNPTEGLKVEDVHRLRSLGYVGGTVSMPADRQAELDSFEPRGGNPRNYAKFFDSFSQAQESIKHGRFPKAERLAREMIEQIPSAAQPYGILAEALGGQQRVPEAIAAAQEALKRAPDDGYILSMYGSLLSDAGRWEDAAAQFRLVLGRNPRDIVVLHNMGVALAFLGRLDEAEQHFQLGLSIQPDSPCLLQAMGVLRSRQNRPTEAKAYLRKALAIDPNFQQAAKDLQDLEGAPKR